MPHAISTAIDVHAITQQVKSAQDDVRQIERLTSQYGGFDVQSAYVVAHLIHDARRAEGATPVGRKIGFTNPDMWSLYGVREPIWAHIYDSTVVHLSSWHSTCSLRQFAEPKIEPEIVFHFRSAPPASGDLSAVLESIDWVAQAFEIVQSHFPGWKFQAADAIAHLIAVLAKQPQYMPLRANELVTTGTITIAQSVCPGETWRTALQGIPLPDLSVEFAA